MNPLFLLTLCSYLEKISQNLAPPQEKKKIKSYLSSSNQIEDSDQNTTAEKEKK